MALTEERFPFFGRTNEIKQLLAAFTLRRNAVISGCPGVGKSALIRHVSSVVPLFVCRTASSIDLFSQEYLEHLGLYSSDDTSQYRRTLAMTCLLRDGNPICFDLPEASLLNDLPSLIDGFFTALPLWIVTRFDPLRTTLPLGPSQEFIHVSVGPLKKKDVRMLFANMIARTNLSQLAKGQIKELYRSSKGNPQQLEKLLSIIT